MTIAEEGGAEELVGGGEEIQFNCAFFFLDSS